MGIGDINGDGLMDYVTTYGWWKQPVRAARALWTYHPAELARWGASQGGAGGAEMGIYDVNGDKLNDVVTALEGHGFGLAWHEQKRDAAGKISFVRHIIMDSALDNNAGGVWFTQPHATSFADINRTAFRTLSSASGTIRTSIHRSGQLGHAGALRLQGRPRPAGARRRAIRARVGPQPFGRRLALRRGDLNKDGTPDITTSGPSGTFIFFNMTKKGSK